MSTRSASNHLDIVAEQSNSFERFAGLSAILAGQLAFQIIHLLKILLLNVFVVD
jgi:hypothetical protein